MGLMTEGSLMVSCPPFLVVIVDPICAGGGVVVGVGLGWGGGVEEHAATATVVRIRTAAIR